MNNLIDFLKFLLGLAIFLIAFLFILGFLGYLIYLIPPIHNCANDYFKMQDEWNNKVNNCVLNKSYRKDCALIIYKDKQIKHQQEIDDQNASAMNGALVGGMIGGSIAHR